MAINISYTEPPVIEEKEDGDRIETTTTNTVLKETELDVVKNLIAGYRQTHDVNIKISFKELKNK